MPREPVRSARVDEYIPLPLAAAVARADDVARVPVAVTPCGFHENAERSAGNPSLVQIAGDLPEELNDLRGPHGRIPRPVALKDGFRRRAFRAVSLRHRTRSGTRARAWAR